MKSLSALLAVLLVLVSASLAQDKPVSLDPAKEVEIRKFMKLSHIMEMTDQLVKETFNQLGKGDSKTVPPEIVDELKRGLDTKSLVEGLVGLYAKYYSLDDLKALNAFYESPAGQHMISVEPQLTKEMAQLQAKWMLENVQKLAADMVSKTKP